MLFQCTHLAQNRCYFFDRSCAPAAVKCQRQPTKICMFQCAFFFDSDSESDSVAVAVAFAASESDSDFDSVSDSVWIACYPIVIAAHCVPSHHHLSGCPEWKVSRSSGKCGLSVCQFVNPSSRQSVRLSVCRSDDGYLKSQLLPPSLPLCRYNMYVCMYMPHTYIHILHVQRAL